MKKLFLIVAAMFAAVSFSACSDDDDNGHVSDKPVLVKQCIITEEYGETDIVYFEYDSQNRISHISSAERTDGKEEFLFSYNEIIGMMRSNSLTRSLYSWLIIFSVLPE